jgi:2-methylcitrate dehydratase PrpD
MAAVGAGIADRGAIAVRSTALATMGTGNAPIWFSGRSSSPIGAAWANSAAASALDLDDGHRLARGHPGAAVIPTALAIGRETGASLEQLIAAIVIGYEVGITIAAARTTYGNTGTWSAYAVVAAATALRGTPVEVIEHALAIAGESAPNQLFASAPLQGPVPEGSDVKEGIPWSVVTGLVALGLAEAGHTGPRNILDSACHYRFPEETSLGSAPRICQTYFKLYACCRHVHAPLDALLGLIERHAIEVRTIDRIEVETYGGALRISNKPAPANLVDVQYSIPYCLALVALVGPQALLPITSRILALGDVKELAGKVLLSLDHKLDARFPAETLARVTIVSGNARFTSEPTGPQGEATSPLTWSALEDKFSAATRMVATEAQQRRVLAAVNDARAGQPAGLMACFEDLTFEANER